MSKLTQLKTRTSARMLGNKQFARQNRTSSHLRENASQVDGENAPRRVGAVPKIKRAEGGAVPRRAMGGLIDVLKEKDVFKSGGAVKKTDNADAGNSKPRGFLGNIFKPKPKKSGGGAQGPIGNPGRISDDSKNEASKLRGEARGHDASAVGSALGALGTLVTRNMGASPGAGVIKRTLFSKPVVDLATATNATMAAGSLGDSRSKRAEANRIEKGLVKEGEEDRKFGGRLTARKKGR